ncbi:MAG: M56 family metallopeptidase [Chitinophagaceae bacterium]
MALLWVVYQLITGLVRSTRPAAKGLLASVLLMGGFAWFIATFVSAFSRTVPAQAVFSSTFINPGSNQLEYDWLQKVLPVASVVYLLLLIFPLLRFIRNYRYVKVIRKYGLTRIQVDWKMFVTKVAGQMGIKKQVGIWVSRFVNSPVTIGFFKPVILVPLAAINNLTPQQLEAVLLHELAHIRRNDYLVNLIINFIRAILYFNPFVRAFIKIVEKEREKSCDEMVLQFQYDSHEYASALLLLQKSPDTGSHFTISAVGRQHDLLNRVELIMGIQKKPVFSFNKITGLFAGLFCIIALNTLFSKKEKGSPYKAATIADIPYSAGPGSYPVKQRANFNPVREHPTAGFITNAVSRSMTAMAIPVEETIAAANYIAAAVADRGVIQVDYEPLVETPVLKKYQEEQVKEALDASRKVLESAQWKAVEKSIADVFTQKEKDEMRADYQKEVSKFDWNKWENKLRAAYDQVDWEKINYQLNYAVGQVRLDSLQRVYNTAMLQLNDVEKELTELQLNGIPDTDITLRSIEANKRQAQRALNSLRTARNKKVVHL